MILTVARSLAISTAAITAVLIVIGLAITHIGPLDRWDERTNAWFVDQRTPTWNSISYWGTFIANTLGVVVVACIATIYLSAKDMVLLAMHGSDQTVGYGNAVYFGFDSPLLSGEGASYKAYFSIFPF